MGRGRVGRAGQKVREGSEERGRHCFWRDVGSARGASALFSSVEFTLNVELRQVYSIVSELAGSTSPTNLMSSLSAHLSSSPSILTILYPPLSFHGGSSGSSTKLRRHRGPTQAIERDPLTGREVMRVRFWVEGGEDPAKLQGRQRGWTDVQYWRELPRRLIGPLITSEPPPPPTPPPPTPEELAAREKAERKEKQRSSWTGWLTGMFGSLMPKTMAKKKEESDGGRWFERKPALGRYRSGEVTAELIRVRYARSCSRSLQVAQAIETSRIKEVHGLTAHSTSSSRTPGTRITGSTCSKSYGPRRPRLLKRRARRAGGRGTGFGTERLRLHEGRNEHDAMRRMRM